MRKELLEAGKIVNTHGVSGEIKVQSWCDSPEVLAGFETLYRADGAPVTVEHAYVHKNCVILRLQDVSTMEQAEALRGQVLYLKRSEVDLPENLVFIQDILGFTVYDERLEREIGQVRDVLTSNPAHQLYEILSPDGKIYYVPAVKPFLKEVDLAAERIRIASIEGLLE